MKMKLMTLALTVALVGSNALPVQAGTSSHIHIYAKEKYVKTEQNGTYTHSYITGVNPITNVVTYGTCLVMCETEYYTYRCEKDWCYATDGSLHSRSVETHANCPR